MTPPRPPKPRTQKGPHLRVFQRNGCYLTYPATAYEGLTHALRHRDQQPWYEAEGLYGSTIFLDLHSVTEVHFLTPASMGAAHADAGGDEEREPWQQ